jgi:hypothetical protein
VDREPDQTNPSPAPAPIGADFIIPLLACGLAIYYMTTTDELVWEARAAGVAIGIPLLILCVVHMARMGMRIATGRATLGTGDLFANTQLNRQRLALAALGILFIACIQWTGTTLGLFLFLCGSMYVLGVRSTAAILIIATTTSMLVYVLLIWLLSSRLPQGPLEKLFGLVLGAGS